MTAQAMRLLPPLLFGTDDGGDDDDAGGGSVGGGGSGEGGGSGALVSVGVAMAKSDGSAVLIGCYSRRVAAFALEIDLAPRASSVQPAAPQLMAQHQTAAVAYACASLRLTAKLCTEVQGAAAAALAAAALHACPGSAGRGGYSGGSDAAGNYLSGGASCWHVVWKGEVDGVETSRFSGHCTAGDDGDWSGGRGSGPTGLVRRAEGWSDESWSGGNLSGESDASAEETTAGASAVVRCSAAVSLPPLAALVPLLRSRTRALTGGNTATGGGDDSSRRSSRSSDDKGGGGRGAPHGANAVAHRLLLGLDPPPSRLEKALVAALREAFQAAEEDYALHGHRLGHTEATAVNQRDHRPEDYRYFRRPRHGLSAAEFGMSGMSGSANRVVLNSLANGVAAAWEECRWSADCSGGGDGGDGGAGSAGVDVGGGTSGGTDGVCFDGSHRDGLRYLEVSGRVSFLRRRRRA